jgi:hypothetical protein
MMSGPIKVETFEDFMADMPNLTAEEKARLIQAWNAALLAADHFMCNEPERRYYGIYPELKAK